MKPRHLIVIAGPTAVGKTSLGIELANDLNTEIISCDSRQLYRELEIGTAKPDQTELSQAKHHFINSHSIEDQYSAGQYESDALQLIDSLHKTYDQLIMVGGSGLYIDAVCNGFDEMPTVDPTFREQLNKEYKNKGLSHLQKMLEAKDPVYYEQVDKNNHQRIIRALEVIESSGQLFSSLRGKKKKVKRSFSIIKIAIDDDREVLFKRIDQRMDQMIQAGLFDEAKKFYDRRHLNALQTVGYSEIFDFLDGKYDYEEAVRLLKRNSRRYAKRQLTWLRRDPEYTWFKRDEVLKIKNHIKSQIN